MHLLIILFEVDEVTAPTWWSDLGSFRLDFKFFLLSWQYILHKPQCAAEYGTAESIFVFLKEAEDNCWVSNEYKGILEIYTNNLKLDILFFTILFEFWCSLETQQMVLLINYFLLHSHCKILCACWLVFALYTQLRPLKETSAVNRLKKLNLLSCSCQKKMKIRSLVWRWSMHILCLSLETGFC